MLVHPLTESPQDLTGSWADLGGEIDTSSAQRVALWMDIDINDSTGVEVRYLCKEVSGGDEYIMQYVANTDTGQTAYDTDITFNEDIDQKVIIELPLYGNIPYIQVQVKCSVVGATAGRIVTSDYDLT